MMLREYLEKMAKAFDDPRMMAMERFVLERGQQFAPQALPNGIKRGKPKQCFRNAMDLALAVPGLRYAEGLGQSVIPVHHAWCVDADGRVVDPTWDKPEDREYFGVLIPHDMLVEEVCKNRSYGVLTVDEWRINLGFMERLRQLPVEA